MRYNRNFSRIGLLVISVGTLLSLTRCGVPLFSTDAVLAAGLIHHLTYEGQSVSPIPDYSNNFDPAALRFVPSRVNPIETDGPDGFLYGQNSSGGNILAVCPNPFDPNPVTSGIRILPSTNDGFGFSSTDPLQYQWAFDTANVSTGFDDYYSYIQFGLNTVYANTRAITYPTQTSTLQNQIIDQQNLDSAVQTGLGITGHIVGGTFGVDSTSGLSYLYLIYQNGSAYYPVSCQLQSSGVLAYIGSIGIVGSDLPLTFLEQPSNGAYFFDPVTLQEYFSYESAGAIKTYSWAESVSSPVEIPVHDLPTAVLPGGKLYVEKDGTASVYNSDGSLAGTVNTGGLHFVHMRWYSPGVEKMIFTYAFAAPYGGQKGVYLRTYSTTVADFFSLLK
ncbi:MAG TPA: hypothetical protein VMW87_03605 [Spirochaetia bacterium]|nr:hypothetical protein [Spirochaetia bacterium]